MEKQTNQSSLERDQPTELNLCPCCAGEGEIVSNPEQNEHSVVCKCGHKISVYNPTLNEWQLTVLKSLWNMSLVQMELSQKTKDALNLTDNSLLVFDISNYTLLKSFNTFLDAITFMEQRFNKDMSRSVLFQLRENRLEYIMVSDELWEDLTDKKGKNTMNAMNRRFSSSEPAVAFSGVFNSCPICSKLPRYTRSSCGGYHLSCCEIRTKSCVPNLTKENANFLREEWNSIVVNSELSPNFVKKYNMGNGNLVIVRSGDSSIFASYDDMDDALACLKQEMKKDFTIDYDLTQLVRIQNGNFVVAHIATSKVLSYVGNWDGFRYELMMPVE